jgi:hypothetical protein
LWAEAGAFGLFNGFVNGGMRGDAIEPEYLIEAEAQQVLQRHFLRAILRLASDEPVERGLPANHAADEFVGEAAIGGGQAGGREGAFEQIFRVFRAVMALPEHAGRNFSWFLTVHFV